MAEALADRLAEAFAEVLHRITRRELWGYAADEQLSADDLLKVKYQGEHAGCSAMHGAWNPSKQVSLHTVIPICALDVLIL